MGVTLGSQWARLAIQLGGFIALARLLTPEDFGIIAMASVVITFASWFAEFGLYTAAVQAETLSVRQRSGLFWLNIGAALVGAVIVAAISVPLSFFYSEPRVVPVLLALACSLVLTGFSIQFRAELNREKRFASLAAQDVTSAAVALACAVVVALAGGGYWALVAQALMQPIVVGVIAVAQLRWAPGRPAPWAELMPFLTYGLHTFGLQLLTSASRTVDVLAVGRVQGPDALGLYSRATQLVNLVLQQTLMPVTRVTLPLLARSEDRVAFNRNLQALHLGIAYPVVGALALLIALADPGIVLLLGADWSASTSTVQTLSISAIFAAHCYAYYWAFLAKARTALLLLSELPGRLLMMIGSILLAPIGIAAVGWAFVVGQVVIFVVGSFVVRRSDVNALPLVGQFFRGITVFALPTVVCFIGAQFMESSWLTLVLLGTAWVVLVSAVMFSVPYSRRDVIRLWSAISRRSG